MKKISALEIFTKAFYFTFSSFDLIFLIFLITGITNTILLIIMFSYIPQTIVIDETSPTPITYEKNKFNTLILWIGILIFSVLVSVLSATIAYLYVFTKRGRKTNLLKILYKTKDYYIGVLILGLIIFSVFLIPAAPFLILFLMQLYGSFADLITILLFFILLAITIYIHLRLSLSLPIYFKRKNVKESLKESWKLMKGNVFKLFLILVLITLISLGFAFVEMLIILMFSPIYFLVNDFVLNVVFSIISSFIGSIITVLGISAHVFFYFKLKGRK
jgi:hypothetical protein